MALAIRNIKYRCSRNTAATKQASLSALDLEPYSLPSRQVPARWWLFRQEPAFFCGRAQSPRGKQWCQAATAFRNQKSWVPNSFIGLYPHLHFPVQCSRHQVRLTFSLIPDSFLSFCTVIQLQQEGKKKSCGKANSLWCTVTPVIAAVLTAMYPNKGVWCRSPSYGMSAALR